MNTVHGRGPPSHCLFFFFFFNDTATTEIYTLSLHDALPISTGSCRAPRDPRAPRGRGRRADRKSTRLNSSHGSISYAVFCLKKKHKQDPTISLLSRGMSWSATPPTAACQ